MDWNISDCRVYIRGNWNGHDRGRGSLHGLNTCLGRSLRVAALVRPKDLFSYSMTLIYIRSLAYQFIIGLPFSSTLAPIVLPTLYLWIVDTLALKRGTWVIESGTKLGWHLWDGLDIEYGTFFDSRTKRELTLLQRSNLLPRHECPHCLWSDCLRQCLRHSADIPLSVPYCSCTTFATPSHSGTGHSDNFIRRRSNRRTTTSTWAPQSQKPELLPCEWGLPRQTSY